MSENPVEYRTQYKLLNNLTEEYKKILADNLIGVYLHGSLAMRCFNPEISDIDFLVVVEKTLDKLAKAALVNVLVQYENLAPKKGFEMSVLLLKDTRNFTYPTPFQLHYSSDHKEAFIKNGKMCENGEDSDLAAHITVLKNRGKCLYGKNIETTFADVPKEDYRRSLIYDIQDAKEMLHSNTTYFILNLCRTLYYLEEGVVASKVEGGKWMLTHVNEKYSTIIQNALNVYKVEFDEQIPGSFCKTPEGIEGYSEKSEFLHSFVDEMFLKIDKLL